MNSELRHSPDAISLICGIPECVSLFYVAAVYYAMPIAYELNTVAHGVCGDSYNAHIGLYNLLQICLGDLMHNVVQCVHYCDQPILFHIGVVNGPWRNAQSPVYKSVCVYITCKERRWAIFLPCIVVTNSLHTGDRELTIPSQDRSAVDPKTSLNIS